MMILGVCSGLAVAAVIFGVVWFAFLSDGVKITPTDSSIVGKWAFDDITYYEFLGDGNGKTCVTGAEHPFRYTVTDDRLDIDYTEPERSDKSYTIVLTKNSMTLTTPGNNVYKLKRMK